MNDSFTTEFAGIPTEVKIKQYPSTMGELGSRWNQLFGTNEVSIKDEEFTPVTQAEMLGMVATGAAYWNEIKDNSEMFRPYWTKENSIIESEWWQKAAECLEFGEGDFESIDHIMNFCVEKVAEQLRTRKWRTQQTEKIKKRLAEVEVWLVDFRKNPRPIPQWQEYKSGIPALKYPKI